MRKRARITNPLEEYVLADAHSDDNYICISKLATVRKKHVEHMVECYGSEAKMYVGDGGNLEINKGSTMSIQERDRFKSKLATPRPKDVPSRSLDELVAAADRGAWEDTLLALARCFELVDEEPFVKKLSTSGVRVAVGIVSCVRLCQLKEFISFDCVEDIHLFTSDDQKIHILVDVRS